MDASDFLASRFEEHRSRLTAVAHRMLGTRAEADDALQEAWLRLSRTVTGDAHTGDTGTGDIDTGDIDTGDIDTGDIDNLGGWLTTVVGRICLDLLRARAARREDPLERLPDPVIGRDDRGDPEQQALIADSVGLALLVVLESLSPAERLAFVLHDMFAVPFEEIATIVDRSPATAKKLASRARQRVRGTAPPADPDPSRHRQAVEAFLTAARGGDYTALLAILDPDVVMRIDAGAGAGGGMWTIRGAAEVAGRAGSFQRFTAGHAVERVLVNGAPGLAGMRDGRPISIMSFTVSGGRIIALDIFADPDRVARLDAAGGGPSAKIM